MYESGALANGISSSNVMTFLIDLEPKDVVGPLASYNHTWPEKAQLLLMVTAINKGLGENKLESSLLNASFEKHFPDFQKEFEKIIGDTSDEESGVSRSDSDIVGEILNRVRGIERNVIKQLGSSPGYSEFTDWGQVRRTVNSYIGMGLSESDVFLQMLGFSSSDDDQQKLKDLISLSKHQFDAKV